MTIKDELKAKLQQVKAKQDKEKRNLESKARKFIEEFIIPKFREIAEKKPTSEYLTISFWSNIDCWYYTSDIDGWDQRHDSPYDFSVVSTAVELAEKEFDIEASETDDGAGGRSLTFCLDLS